MSKENQTAITVVDVQRDFFNDQDMVEEKNRLVEKINELTQIARSNNTPIIWVRQEFKKDLSDAYLGMRRDGVKFTTEGDPGSELLPELIVGDGDDHIIKKRYSAFFDTELRELLESKGVKKLIVGGVKTHNCVRMTVVDAYQNDFDVILATDCLANVGDEHDEITVKFLCKHMATEMTNEEIISSIFSKNIDTTQE